MNESQEGKAPEEEKSAAQLDYEEGVKFLEKNEISQAAIAFHNALLGFEQEGNDKGIANASDKLAELCLVKEDFDKALIHVNRALDICRQGGDNLSLTYLKKKLVKALWGMGQHQEALAACFDLLDAYHDYNNPDGVVKTLEQIAAIYLEIGEPAKAADSYRTAASIHKNFGHSRQAQAFLDKAAALEG